MNDLEHRVNKLQAIEDIRCLKARYAAACDAGYLSEQMRPLFTENVICDFDHFGRIEGLDALCAFFQNVSGRITWALHYMVAPDIEVDDDLNNARGTWYLWQPCTMETSAGPQAVWITGRYVDRYHRERGAWKFAEVQLDCQTITPVEEGWVRRRFLNGD